MGKKVIGAILFVLYSIIAIIVTVLLLSYNDYNCSEIGGYTIYTVNDDSLEPEYDQGSILMMEGTSDKHVNIGDEMFLYKVINSQEYEIVTRTLKNKVQQGRHIVYECEEGETYASEYFIARVEDTKVIGSPWGTILSILESKWGYLFCIVVVSLLLFLQEVFNLVIEIRYGGKKGEKSGSGAKTTKKSSSSAKTSSTKASGSKKTTTKKSTTATATKAKVSANINAELNANVETETKE